MSNVFSEILHEMVKARMEGEKSQKKINKFVVDYCVSNITTNLQQYNIYIDDLTKLPEPMERPQYENKGSYTYDISNLL